MNQILQVEHKSKPHKPINTKRVILFFIIFIILFGLSIGIYFIYEGISNGNITLPEGIFTPKKAPIILLTRTEDNKIIINAESEIGLNSITYNWNDMEKETIQLSGINNMEKTIDIPLGENVLYVSVIDIKEIETKKQQNYLREKPKPVIDLYVIGTDLKVTVTSTIELAEITYTWNTDTVKKEDMSTYENKLKFEKKLQIPIGQNTLTILAKDKDGNQTEKVQEIKGVTKATTTIRVMGEYIHFAVTGSENIKKVEFVFNGKKYLMDKNAYGDTKIVHYKLKLIEGKNYLTVTSTTQSDGVDTATFEQEYTSK